ncbi:MAG: DUF6519 domain-containing protein [Solirubrobacteraceae bacterium]
MMYGNFSRVLDDMSGSYSAVLAQQGRFVLDADVNAQTSIVLDYMRGLATDLIGPFAGPMEGCGFAVKRVRARGERHSVRLGSGHYYVYGLRCELPTAYWSADEELHLGESDEPRLIALLVWEQAVGAIQEPGIVDPGLGAESPATTRRRQVRWRPIVVARRPDVDIALALVDATLDRETETETETAAAAAADVPPTASADSGASLEDVEDVDAIIRAIDDCNMDLSRRPTLAAQARSSAEPDPGPSTAPTVRGYRGVENHLYRVEVHRGGGADTATFKWSRDNGSAEFGLEGLEEHEDGMRTATLACVPDASQTLEIGDWVEYVDDAWAPTGHAPALMQVAEVWLSMRRLTLRDADRRPRQFDRSRHPLLRRWDQDPQCEEPHHGIPLRHADRATWFNIEDGVQIRFMAESARYERGDYWLIPARTATAGVLWPQSAGHAEPLMPNGPARYLAPLALVAGGVISDRRARFGSGSKPVAPDATVDVPTASETTTQAVEADGESSAQARNADLPSSGDDQQTDAHRATPATEATRAPETATGEAPARADESEATPSEPKRRFATIAHEAIERVERVEHAVTREGVTHSLRSIGTVQPGKAHEARDQARIGRGEDTEIQIEHPDVSRHHAMLGVHHGETTITDLGSTNGTKVNDQQLAPHEPKRLELGDRIEVGSPEVQFQFEEASKGPRGN